MQRWRLLVEPELAPRPLSAFSMPFGLLSQRIHVNATRRRPSGDTLPRRAGAGVHDGDLEAVRREPARVVEILIAVTTPAAGALDHHLASREVAHDPIRARSSRCGILTYVSDVATIGRDEDILVGHPHVWRNWTGLHVMLAEAEP
jgi:hypothetical protein